MISPQRHPSKRATLAFVAKRRIERAAHRLAPRGAAVLLGSRSGPWRHLQRLALRAGTPVIFPPSTADPAVVSLVREARADLVIVAGLDRIFGPRTIAACPPIFNVHPSLLPAHRGPVPEFWQLASGATTGGVTIHRVDAGIDTGPIVAQQAFAIEPWFDAPAFLARSLSVALPLLHRLLDTYPAFEDHADSDVIGWRDPLPTAADLAVPFYDPATAVYDRARAAGWSVPLTVHLPRRPDDGELVDALDGPPAPVTVDVRDPVPFPTHDLGPPGRSVPSPGGGLAIACNPGTVYFAEAITRHG
jgi:methionyl-tRNA formyltransferase